MKFRTFVFSLIALSFIATLFAAEPQIIGSGNYGIETFESLQGAGIVKLHGTSITNTLQVSGSLISSDAKIGTVDIMGEANLTDTTVQHGGTIQGSLQAVRSTFKDTLTILCHKAIFTASRLEAINVQIDTGFKGKQVIELKQGSVINGPIHFESGKGEVVIYPGCQVYGHVTGGKVIKKS